MKSLKAINKYFVRYKWHFIWGFFFVAISNVFGVFIAPLVRKTIDLTISNSLENKNISDDALFFALLILGSSILKGLFMFLMRQSIIVASRRIEFDLKNDIYRHYQSLSAAFYKKNYTGDLMNRISEDVSRVRMYVGPAVMYFISMFSLFIIVIYSMVSINPMLTLYVLLPLPILSFLVFKVNSYINKQSDAIQAQLSKITTFVQENISGIRVLKAYNALPASRNMLEHENEIYKNTSLKLAKTESIFSPLITFLVGLSSIIVIWLGGDLVIKGEFTYGNIAEFVIYVNMLTWPVASLGWSSSLVQRAAASQARINQFLDEKSEIVSGDFIKKDIHKGIQFQNVSIQFSSNRKFALKNINLTIPKGSSLGILGTTGSGKSTVANLLLRHFDITEGKILIDETDIRKLDLTSYRQLIGYVPQDVFLFSDTIRGNILMGSTEEITEETLIKITKQAHIYEDIMDFPFGFDTIIGERGLTLSGGQKQRLSLARALVRNPQLLILDDVLSAVDVHTEKTILNHLDEIMKDKTTIIISHRISSVQKVNHIIVLEEGEIIEEGTHEQLLALNGKYQDIYMEQNK